MRVKKILFLYLFLALATSTFPAHAQRVGFIGEMGMDLWFDNREYKSDYTPDITLFGTKIVPELGLIWREGNSINVGADFIIDFGDKGYKRNPELIIYYSYRSEKFNAYAGIFQRKKLWGDYPTLFFSDSVRYYDNNLEGALFQYGGGRGYVELACDWLSMMSDRDREKFVVFSSGKIFLTGKRDFFAGYYASLFHHSVSYTQDGVVDNLLAYPYVGYKYGDDYSHGPRGDFHLMIKLGWIQGMQRDRQNENKFVKPGGFQAEVRIEKCKLGIYNTFYAGDNMMPYYDRYGPGLYQGDSFYRTEGDIYNRLEFYWNPVRRSDMNLKVSSVHHYDGHRWGWQQLVTLSVLLNKNTVRRY